MGLPYYNHEIKINKPKIEYIVEDIDQQVRLTKNYSLACIKLKEIGLDNDLVLKYFDSYISKVEDNKLLKNMLKPPLTIIQYMVALNAAVSCKDADWITYLLSEVQIQDKSNSYVKELEDKAKKIVIWKKM